MKEPLIEKRNSFYNHRLIFKGSKIVDNYKHLLTLKGFKDLLVAQKIDSIFDDSGYTYFQLLTKENMLELWKVLADNGLEDSLKTFELMNVKGIFQIQLKNRSLIK